MLVVLWIAFLLVMLFLLGSTVGSFLNVCIVRLPEGRSLIRPASCCGHCHNPIPMRDNLPLVSYCLLRGRCRLCGASFSMHYFWIELLTGLVFGSSITLRLAGTSITMTSGMKAGTATSNPASFRRIRGPCSSLTPYWLAF